MCGLEPVSTDVGIEEWGRSLGPGVVKALAPILSHFLAKAAGNRHRYRVLQDLYFEQTKRDIEKGTIRIVEEQTPKGGFTYATKAIHEAVNETPANIEVHTVGERFSERWAEQAYSIDNEEMAKMWSHILSGEMRRPGSSSLHTMDLLSRLSQSEAQLIDELLAPRYIGSAVWHIPEEINFTTRSLDPAISQLRNIGVLEPHVVQYDLGQRDPPHELDKDIKRKRTISLSCNSVVLEVSYIPAAKLTMEVTCIPLTLQGLDLCRLSRAETDLEYLKGVQDIIHDRGFDTAVVDKGSVFHPPGKQQPGSLADKHWL